MRLVHRLRFALWRTALTARLRRHGVRVRIEGSARFFTPPRLEVITANGPGGTLTIRLGDHVKLGRELILEVWTGVDNLLQADDRATFEAYCRVQLQGGEIVLANDVQVRDLCLLKTKSRLTVGERTILSRGVHLHATAGIDVGADIGVGERTSMIDSDHTHDGSQPFLELPLKLGPIQIGDTALISANCVLLRGTIVGPGCVVAANSVLNGGEFPAGHLVAGAPAQAKRPLATV